MSKKSRKRNVRKTKRVDGSLRENGVKSSSASGARSLKAEEFIVKYLPFLILAVGVFTRLLFLGKLPGGLNQDEAFSGYEALSILKTGKDSFGYNMPVYLTAWGSGMNALNTYLILPFLALCGAHTWVLRLPQALVACFSLWVFYLLLKKLYNEKVGLIGLAFLSVCPWHILLSRWGLESNLAPGFLLFGMYFFVLGLKKSKYFMLSALFYGLSLYTYATIWPVVPFMILFEFIYGIWIKKVKFNKDLVISALILIVFAIPLLLFLMVNKGYINEIKTPLLSIPKLVVMRDSEISFSNIRGNLNNLFNILLSQNDGLIWNYGGKFGLYYFFTIPFFFIGAVFVLKDLLLSIKNRKLDGSFFVFFSFLMGLVIGAIIFVNVNRVNFIHIPIIWIIVVGMTKVIDFLGKKIRYLYIVAALALFVPFGMFMNYYTGDYKTEIGNNFQSGLEEACDYAKSIHKDQTYYVSENFTYSKVLYLLEINPKTYRESREFTNYPSPYLGISGCDDLSFTIDGNVSSEGIYMIPADWAQGYKDAGCKVKIFDHVAVVTAS